MVNGQNDTDLLPPYGESVIGIAVNFVEHLSEDVHVPGRLKDVGISESALPCLAESAIKVTRLLVNPSTPWPEGQGLLRVDPERRFFTPPSKAGLAAAEWVNNPRKIALEDATDIYNSAY